MTPEFAEELLTCIGYVCAVVVVFGVVWFWFDFPVLWRDLDEERQLEREFELIKREAVAHAKKMAEAEQAQVRA